MPKFRVPHTLVLLMAMIALALVLTWILPAGEFQREVNDKGREQVVAGTYASISDHERSSIWTMFTAIPRGFAEAQDIIFFVLIIGGAFEVLRATGAIDAVIGVLLQSLGRRPFWLIAGGMLVFSVGSSTIGMAEEYIPFVPILLALALGLGFDAITAMGILCVGYGIGYGAAIFNPFTVLIAQNVAGVQPASAITFRLVLWAGLMAVGIHHVWRYAKKVQAAPAESLVADIEPDPSWQRREERPLTVRDGFVLGLVTAAIALIVYGLTSWDWYIVEMGAVFIGLAVVLCLITHITPDDAAKHFCQGAADLTSTALLIGFARSILVVLEEGQVIDTIVHGISLPLVEAGPTLASIGMLAFQSVCNLFIPSGSGQAYVTMPVMAPLSDLVGVQRQVAVLAYQLGDGLTNIMVPTNAALIGILTMAKVPFERWLRFVLPFMVKAWIVSGIALAAAVWIGLS